VAAAVAVATGAVLLAAGCGGKSFPAGVSGLRVCGQSSFDESAKQCRTDNRGSSLVSSRFICSARVGKRNGESFLFRFLRNGRPVSTQRGTVPSDGWTVAFSVAAGGLLGNRALIGGNWRCELRVGTAPRAVAAFRSGGPTEVVLHLSACPTSETRLDGRTRVCRTNQSLTPFRGVRSVTCSATLVAARGKLLEVQLAYLGRRHAPRRSLSSQVKIESLLQPVGVRFFSRSGPLTAGRYACRLSIAGQTLAAMPFRIR
jgi:hypothetical protein